MADHQHLSFEMVVNLNEEVEREFGASNSAVSFQIAQIKCGADCVPVSLVIYIDGSFIKHTVWNMFCICMYYLTHKHDIYMLYTCLIHIKCLY